jgi:nicotinamidase-related amidase
VVIDVQTSLVPHIHEGEKVVDRIAFLTKVARVLDIPIVVTEQNPSRMGSTVPELGLSESAIAKMAFSARWSKEFLDRMESSERNQVVILGLETHICVGLTAIDLMARDYEVAVCPDGVGARTLDRHKLGMERIRDAGVMPIHTEAVAYEWLESAEHPKFRDVLAIVKAHP